MGGGLPQTHTHTDGLTLPTVLTRYACGHTTFRQDIGVYFQFEDLYIIDRNIGRNPLFQNGRSADIYKPTLAWTENCSHIHTQVKNTHFPTHTHTCIHTSIPRVSDILLQHTWKICRRGVSCQFKSILDDVMILCKGLVFCLMWTSCVLLHVNVLYSASRERLVFCFMWTSCILLHVNVLYSASCEHLVFCLMWTSCVLLHVNVLYSASRERLVFCFMWTSCILLHVNVLYSASCEHLVSCLMWTSCVLLHVDVLYSASCERLVFCFMWTSYILLHVNVLYSASCERLVFCFTWTSCILLHVNVLYSASCERLVFCFMWTSCILLYVTVLYSTSCKRLIFCFMWTSCILPHVNVLCFASFQVSYWASVFLLVGTGKDLLVNTDPQMGHRHQYRMDRWTDLGFLSNFY